MVQWYEVTKVILLDLVPVLVTWALRARRPPLAKKNQYPLTTEALPRFPTLSCGILPSLRSGPYYGYLFADSFAGLRGVFGSVQRAKCRLDPRVRGFPHLTWATMAMNRARGWGTEDGGLL